MKIAIIGGTGKMGKWFARFLLSDGKQVVISGRDRNKLEQARKELGVEAIASIPQSIKGADVVLLSVPIDSFEAIVKQIQPFVTKNQIIIEITSVKTAPVAALHKHLKSNLVLGVHPMFGPGAKSIENQNFVLTPTSPAEAELAKKVEKLLLERKARATTMTPEEHDKMMAVVLGLAHFIAIVSADTLLNFDRIAQMKAVSGTSYKMLLLLAEGVVAQDPEFYSMLQMNLPEIQEVEALFQKNTTAWAEMVKNKDQKQFSEKMALLKAAMENADPDFNKAYQDMYRLLDGQ
jgi:prephenate dehydrogenase